MPLEMEQQILAVMGVLFVLFLIFMLRWARKMRDASGWALLEQRYPQKNKFLGNWQINKPIKLAAIRGYYTVDVGSDSLYLYLRPTQHGDILKKAVQIPWSAIEGAAIAENYVDLTVTGDKRIILGLDYAASTQLNEITKMISLTRGPLDA